LGGEGEIPTIVILPPIVMLNLFQHPFARRPWILKQVQGDECLQWVGSGHWPSPSTKLAIFYKIG